MIQTEDLSKAFGDFIAVDGVNLRVEAGEVLALLGPNGAGKTTTVRLLTSVLRPTRGRAWVAGFDVVQHPQKVRAHVGVLTEHHGLYARMSGEEYLLFFAELYGLRGEDGHQRVHALLEQFGLAAAARRRIGEYSKGMRQKLALVRALLHSPPVLLLDEPTSAMDPENARIVRETIRSLRAAQHTIVLCTHNLTEAETLADRIAIIRRGRILFNDTPEALKHHLLGTPLYEIRLAQPWDGSLPPLPSDVEIVDRGSDWIHLRIGDPHQTNPLLLGVLTAANIPLLTFSELPRSLEEAYLRAMTVEEPNAMA
ncbi:ABC transporter ATP-binding protein [uncultured Thermanaerothrix sp.]|uniref:ABC transporter ATP-binding protein n=1 Tax=uncultured Thermanaerothrix sp. TaxID=1195149 RepID=UPI0026139236|nr:ABC transporter ATP-binding protein [uncultured Thermanaerothrix sp.]